MKSAVRIIKVAVILLIITNIFLLHEGIPSMESMAFLGLAMGDFGAP